MATKNYFFKFTYFNHLPPHLNVQRTLTVATVVELRELLTDEINTHNSYEDDGKFPRSSALVIFFRGIKPRLIIFLGS